MLSPKNQLHGVHLKPCSQELNTLSIGSWFHQEYMLQKGWLLWWLWCRPPPKAVVIASTRAMSGCKRSLRQQNCQIGKRGKGNHKKKKKSCVEKWQRTMDFGIAVEGTSGVSKKKISRMWFIVDFTKKNLKFSAQKEFVCIFKYKWIKIFI